MTERNEKLKNLIGYLSANKINNCNSGEGRKKKKKNPKESTEQIKK